jgi:hypothetical protein
MAEVTYYVALPFVFSDDGVAAGEPAECLSANAAVMRAEALSRMPGHAGAIAFSRTGDPSAATSATPSRSGSPATYRTISAPFETPLGLERDARMRGQISAQEREIRCCSGPASHGAALRQDLRFCVGGDPCRVGVHEILQDFPVSGLLSFPC